MFRDPLQFFTASTLAAMYCDLDAMLECINRDIDAGCHDANVAYSRTVQQMMVDVLDALNGLVGEDDAEELIDAERAKG